MRSATNIVVVAAVCGLLLHSYQWYSAYASADFESEDKSSVFLAVLFLWSMLPYLVYCGIGLFKKCLAPGVGASVAILIVDLYVHYTVFIAPQSSTAAIGLLFAPLWHLAVIGPIGALFSWPIVSFFVRREVR